MSDTPGDPRLREILNRLAAAWRVRVGAASRQALLVLFLLALCGGAHLARVGTLSARIATGSLLALGFVLLVVRALRERRTYRDLRRMLKAVLLPSDRSLGLRTLRAVSLLDRTQKDASVGSVDLAKLHFERLLARASIDSVEKAADRRAGHWRIVMLLLLGGLVAAFAVGPMRVIEGLDVLFARKGRAPLPLAWLDYMHVSAEPPGYLRQSERFVFPGLETRHPEGTLLTVRGIPRRDGRKLVLTDGETEVPFVSDGSGGVVARWSLDKSSDLKVAARFGDVRIEELDSIPLRVVADTTPEVTVEGAPKTIELKDVENIEIRYEAVDDHGLRQIDVVLRAGGREDRRVLARLDGESIFERGGYALSPRDPFLRRMYLPVLVTVEARDNDPIRGPKWGVSAPITLIPPVLGEPEAARYVALVGARDALVDFLAWQLGQEGARKKQPLAPPPAAEQERARRAADAMKTAADKAFGGLGVPHGLRAFLLGQMRVLERAPRPGESRARRTEDVVLAVDVAVRTLAARDAQSVAKRLADVVEEVAEGAKQARETEKRDHGLRRFDAALGASDKAAAELAKLGLLGRDLGGVAVADLGRVRRARQAEDLFHAELAARHLAARLRRPTPSFGSARRGGVESGGSPSGGGQSGEASDAQDRFDELANELEQLAQQHADEIGKVERSLAEAEQGMSLDSLREEAKQRAEAIRRAIGDLPQTSHTPGSARASAALGREHGGAMAQSLERLSLADAVQSGRDAMSALEDADRKKKGAAGQSDWVDDEALKEAKRRVKEQLSWAERELDKLKRGAEERARSSLSSSGEHEQGFSRRAGNLASRGKHGETALPEDSVENLEKAEGVMREAARELADGKGDRGLTLQREAQRLLERATTGQTGDDDEQAPPDRSRKSSKGADGGKDIRTGGEVPRPEDSKRAEDFRKRVLEGLAKSKDGRLAPAVKRYAEGLLR